MRVVAVDQGATTTRSIVFEAGAARFASSAGWPGHRRLDGVADQLSASSGIGDRARWLRRSLPGHRPEQRVDACSRLITQAAETR